MEDHVEFRHSPYVSGVSVLDAQYSARRWDVVNSAFGLAVPSDWVGELRYRGQQRVFRPGEVFCTEPGEVHSTPRILQPGSFKVLVIDDPVLMDYVGEIAPSAAAFSFRSIGGQMSPELARRLNAVFNAFSATSTPLYVQSTLIELAATVVDELMDHRRRSSRQAAQTRGLERARECLHEGDSGWIDLVTLSQEAGVSRFHLVRAFKQRYGLPPHAYQVGLRIAKAQRLLRAGLPSAHVAAECGFVDQSHLTRHFKQVLGVPPGRFARDLRPRA